jgi:uncharacterized membrane protein YoaK (UPF0700 family)
VPAPPPEERLRVAALLSLAGGFLDAFTWVGHGGVFANAQTGNVVLLGVFAAAGRFRQAAQHIPPIIAFLFGVCAAHLMRVHGAHRAALVSLAAEVLLLLFVAVLPTAFPDLPIVLGIAFVAAMQTSSFPRVEGAAYSSVMTTGNLRRMAEALFAGTIPPRDPAALPQARAFAAVCAAFGLGAGIGAFATVRLHNAAVIGPIAALLVALAACRPWRRAAGTG